MSASAKCDPFEFITPSGMNAGLYYQKGKLLGRGRDSCVYEYTFCLNPDIKIAVKFPNDTLTQNAYLKEECALWVLGGHNNIVMPYEVRRAGGAIELIMLERCEPSVSNAPMPVGDVREIVRDVLTGLDFMHCNGIMHRDIKAQNVLIRTIGTRPTAVIADFGTATMKMQAKKCTGTSFCMAPELARNYVHQREGQELQPYNEKVDIWAIGCLALQLLTCERPFDLHFSSAQIGPNDDEGMMTFLSSLEEYTIPEVLLTALDDPSGGLYEFLECCFAIDPNDRPSAAELLQHPWMVGDYSEASYEKILNPILANTSVECIAESKLEP